MQNFKNCKKNTKGFSLIEALIAIAVVGIMLSGLLNLQYALMSNTSRSHKLIQPIISLKNFLYDTERKLQEKPEIQEKIFKRKVPRSGEELRIDIKDTKEDKAFKKLPSLGILNLTATSTLGKTTLKDRMISFVSLPAKDKKTDEEKNKQKNNDSLAVPVKT